MGVFGTPRRRPPGHYRYYVKGSLRFSVHLCNYIIIVLDSYILTPRWRILFFLSTTKHTNETHIVHHLSTMGASTNDTNGHADAAAAVEQDNLFIPVRPKHSPILPSKLQDNQLTMIFSTAHRPRPLPLSHLFTGRTLRHSLRHPHWLPQRRLHLPQKPWHHYFRNLPHLLPLRRILQTLQGRKGRPCLGFA